MEKILNREEGKLLADRIAKEAKFYTVLQTTHVKKEDAFQKRMK